MGGVEMGIVTEGKGAVAAGVWIALTVGEIVEEGNRVGEGTGKAGVIAESLAV